MNSFGTRIVLALIAFLCLTNVQLAKAQFTSPYLANPDLNIGYVDSCAQFWLPTWDEDGNGGFWTEIGRSGNVLSTNNKNMITQSRNAYGLVRAFQMTGNEAYLTKAREALVWMHQHAWDEEYGGWINDLNGSGNPWNINGTKTAFYQHYALLGLAAYYEATGDPEIYAMLMAGWDHMDDTFYEDGILTSGYYDWTNRAGTLQRDKSFNATVDAITTHVLFLGMTEEDDFQYQGRLQDLSYQIQDHLVPSMAEQAIGFAEHYNTDWEIDESETLTLMGHVLKTAWCLGRIHRVTGDAFLLDDMETLFYDVWDLGYDHDLGGPYKDFNRVTGEMVLWGNSDTTKAWWQMEQGIMAGLMLDGLMDGPEPLTMADESSDFFMTHFVDRTYGEVYADRTRYGDLAWNENKGSGGKAGYHSIETGYYSYLYANLFHLGAQATLHYDVVPRDSNWEMMLRPVAARPGEVQIASVTLNGEDFEQHDAVRVFLGADQGGEMVVTFEPGPNAVAESIPAEPVRTFSLNEVYPNPFNSTTRLSMQLDRPGRVEMMVYSVDGRLVQSRRLGRLSTGRHAVSLQLPGYASGTYFVRLRVGVETETARVILVR